MTRRDVTMRSGRAALAARWVLLAMVAVPPAALPLVSATTAQAAPGDCAQPIGSLSTFVRDLAAITGGSAPHGARYGTLGECLDVGRARAEIAGKSPRARKQLAGKLLTALADPRLRNDAGRQARANAVALLTELARAALAARDPDATFFVDCLLEAASKENDALLRRQLAINVDGLSARMNAAQKRKAAGLLEEYFPSSPPYAEIFGADGEKTEVNYVIYGGDDTFDYGNWDDVARDYGATLKKTGRGRGLELTYTVTPDDPTGRLKPVTFKIKVLDDASRSWDDLRAFDRMDEADYPLLAYSYHSQYGRALRESMAEAPADAGFKKVFHLGSCKAKVFASRTARLFPSAHLIATIETEYFVDMSRSQMAMMKGYANRETWDQIARRLNGWEAGLSQDDNYLFPNDRRHLEYRDTDADGIPDRWDTVLNVRMRDPSSVDAGGFSPRRNVGRAGCDLSGDRLSYAVPVANGIIGYSSYAGHVADTFIAAGWGSFDKDGPIFTFERGKDPRGKAVNFVKTNPAYSHLNDDALVAAMVREFTLKGLADGNGGTPSLDDRIAAYALGASVLDNWDADDSYDAYQAKFGFEERSLDMKTVLRKIDHDRSVTRETVDYIKSKLQGGNG